MSPQAVQEVEIPHPTIENRTGFAFEPLYLTDEEARPLFVSLVKATFEIPDSGPPRLAEKQEPASPAGKYWGDPDTSSYKHEPECAFVKPAADVVLIGHAYAPRKGVNEVLVGLQVGPVRKLVKVIGDRTWISTAGTVSASEARPFEKIPLIYENAFGGWDRSHPDPERHAFDPRNPVGTGFRSKHGSFEEGVRLPNLEDPSHPLRGYGDMPPPAGFGFTSPHWQPRVSLAGTYDDAWMKERMPLLPVDFNRRFFNGAPPGLICPGFLKGDEDVLVENASPGGKLAFHLPGVTPPKCRVQLVGEKDHELETRLDTVIINTDDGLVFLIWRAHMVLRSGPHDVVAVEVRTEDLPVAVEGPGTVVA